MPPYPGRPRCAFSPPPPFPCPGMAQQHTMQGGSVISSACTARGGRWGPASFIPGTGSRRSGLPHGPVGEGGRAEPPPAPHQDWAEEAGGPRVPPLYKPPLAGGSGPYLVALRWRRRRGRRAARPRPRSGQSAVAMAAAAGGDGGWRGTPGGKR